jgi:hypothetical protein
MHRIARLNDPQRRLSRTWRVRGEPVSETGRCSRYSKTNTTRRSHLLHIFIAALQILSRNPCSTFSLVIRATLLPTP